MYVRQGGLKQPCKGVSPREGDGIRMRSELTSGTCGRDCCRLLSLSHVSLLLLPQPCEVSRNLTSFLLVLSLLSIVTTQGTACNCFIRLSLFSRSAGCAPPLLLPSFHIVRRKKKRPNLLLYLTYATSLSHKKPLHLALPQKHLCFPT